MIPYKHFAIPNLFLVNGYKEIQTPDGIEREYDQEDALEQCVRSLLLRNPQPLRGWDLRFLRNGLGLSQAEFGQMVERDAQTIARWEKAQESVPKFVDLMIRARFAERFEPKIKLAELLSFSDGTAPRLPTYIQLSLTKNGWEFDFQPRTILPSTKAHAIGFAALPRGHGPVQMLSQRVIVINDPSAPDHHFSIPLESVMLYSHIETLFTQSANVPVPPIAETFDQRTLQ